MGDRDSRWILAGDALIALARAYADNMQVEWGEALKRSQVTMLRYLSAGHWSARAATYHCEKTTITEGRRGGLKLERVWDLDDQEWVIPREYWKVLKSSGADQDANWHLAEFDLPPYNEEEFLYSGFARRVELSRRALAQTRPVSASYDQQVLKRSGRPSVGSDKYLSELERRIAAGELAISVADQSRDLHHWYRAMYPDQKAPASGTIENVIRARYRDAKDAMK